MLKKPQERSYQIQAEVRSVVCLQMDTVSLEEAITKAKDFKADDFVEYVGEHIDGDFRISGVYEG